MRARLRDRSCFVAAMGRCFACVIIRGFFAAEGRTPLRARSVVPSFLRMAELLHLAIDRGFVAADGQGFVS